MTIFFLDCWTQTLRLEARRPQLWRPRLYSRCGMGTASWKKCTARTAQGVQIAQCFRSLQTRRLKVSRDCGPPLKASLCPAQTLTGCLPLATTPPFASSPFRFLTSDALVSLMTLKVRYSFLGSCTAALVRQPAFNVRRCMYVPQDLNAFKCH